MLETTVAVIALAAFLYGALWVLARVPFKHRTLTPERLNALLAALLKRGVDGGFLVIKARGHAGFVQFKLYVTRSGRRGIRSDYPRAPWSKPYYDAVRELLVENGIEFERTPTHTGEVSEFLTIDFGQDVDSAQAFATSVLTEVYRVSPAKDAVATLHGVRD
jgi:hypothetical protein